MPLQRSTSPFPEIPSDVGAYARWVRADLVGELVLRDPEPNRSAVAWNGDPANFPDDTGLLWALELMTEALQCGTHASWFLRAALTSADDEPHALVQQRLDDFADERGLDRRWYEQGEIA